MFFYLQDGQTPLYIAIRKGHAAVMKILLKKYADIALCTKVYTHTLYIHTYVHIMILTRDPAGP